MTWQTLLFIPIALTAFGIAGYRLFILLKLLKAQKGSAKPIEQISARIKTTLINVLGQKAVLQDRKPGLMHAIIFWGFIIITTGTIEQFATTIHPALHFEFIGHWPYQALLFLQDIFTTAVLFAVAYSFYRRLVIRPVHLGKSRDALWILTFTGGLMLAIFLMNAFAIIAHNPWYAAALPASGLFASLLSPFEMSVETAAALSIFFKWVHMLLVLGFTIYIPGSKHLHILAAGPNTFLRTLPREKAMRKIDFTNESVTQYGAAKVTDLSWKDTLDYYSCTECGRCQSLCPAWNTEKPLSPKNIISDLKYNLYRNKDAVLAGKYDEVTHIIDDHVTEDVIWACTSCRACEIACPVFIEQTDKIYDIRRNLVMMESKFPAEIQTVFKNMETNASPWAFPAADRAKWAEGLNVKTMAEDSKVDLLLWAGCAGSFDDRNKKVLRSFVSLLKKAEIKFAILGTEEQCTGDPARRIGNEYLFQTLAQTNIETLNRYQVKKIVTACPHCFNTLKNEYKDFGGTYEVYHHSQLIAQLIADGKIKPTKSVDDTVTFHDSCYLGRWNNVYEQPRATIAALPSVRMVEMKQSHDQSLCCGAGGGRMFMEEKLGKRINVTRTEQALETKAGIVASACPFCITMITDGVKTKEMQSKVKVMDIAELVDQSTP